MKILKHVAQAAFAFAVYASISELASAQDYAREIYRDAIFNRPTVSPYLSLFNNTGSGTTPYYSFVRPQLEQQRANREANERMANLQVELNRQTAAGSGQRGRRIGVQPTGHAAGRMYYSHYFPGMTPQPRR